MPLTALEQAALVRSGEVSATELVEAALAAIERSELNAFAAVCGERALAQAARVKPGDRRPLAGVPIAVKDLFYAVAGLPTAHGSWAFGDWIPDHDAPHVRGLTAAGAIVVGKTTTPELGLRPVTDSLRYGITRNPRDPGLTAGGSSGGSAAAVGAGLVGLADGSDMGGSIRIPAACCGVVGLRPSRGVVDNGEALGDVLAESLTPGPIARSVRDAAAALDAMTARAEYVEAARTAPPRLRVRVTYAAPDGVPVDDAPRAATARAASLLSALGHDVVEHTPPWDDGAFAPAWGIAGAASLRYGIRLIERMHGRPADLDALEPANRGWLAAAPPIPAEDLLGAFDALRAFARRILADWDTIQLCPTITRLPGEAGALAPAAGIGGEALRYSAIVRVWSATGQPALSLPFDDSAVQLVAAPGCDDLVLSLAAQLEGALA